MTDSAGLEPGSQEGWVSISRDEQSRLALIIAAARSLALLWFPLLLLTGWLADRAALMGSALVMLPMLAGLAAARRRVEAGRVEVGAALFAAVLDGGALVLTALLPWAYPVLAMTVLVAAAAVLPYLQGSWLRRLFVATGAAVAAVGVIGVVVPDTGSPGPWQKGLLMVLGLVSNASLVVLLLWQFASRQRRLLDAERSARAHEERLARQLSFLLQASTDLNATLDEPRAQQAALDLLVPRLAEVGALVMKLRDGSLGPMSVRARDPADEALLRELAQVCPWTDDEVLGAAQALRHGQPVRVPHLTEDRIVTAARNVSQSELLRRLRLTSTVCLPINTRRGTEGLLVLGLRQARDGQTFPLIDAVAERAALALDNARLYREAVEGLQARDEFLSVAAHELRTPLTSLVLGVQTARELAASGGPVLLERALGLVEQQCLRLSQLVETLLDLSRIHVGQLELHRTSLNLLQLAREAVGRAAGAIRSSGSVVTVSGDEDVVGPWDRLHLEQALTNLLANALKYGRGRPVEMVVSRAGGLARLSVIDHGIGIEAERQEEIFERFVRAVSARQYGGLGLGLYIARRAVEAHGGTLRVQSQAGQGSTFTLELPLE
jgi:signal transduction histidine kinase